MICRRGRETLEVLKRVLSEENTNEPYDVDWKSVYEEMKAQAVFGLLGNWLNTHDIQDRELQKRWGKEIGDQFVRWFYMMKEQERLIRLLKDNGIDLVIMKGSANAMFYPYPELRKSGDIDFLVRERDFEKAYKVLLNNHYKQIDEYGADHHIQLEKKGVVFELHRRPAGADRIPSGKWLTSFFEKGIDHSQSGRIDGFCFPVFPPLQNGLVLLLQIVHHLREGLGLRPFIDWMMFADRYLDDGFWEQRFQPVIRRAGLEQMTVIMTRMCQIYLGLRKDHMTWCSGADPGLCESMMEYILEQGEFGLKNKPIDRGAKVLMYSGNPIAFLKLIQQRGLRNWETAQKYPLLRPFAWTYEVVKYLRIGLGRKNPVGKLLKDAQTSRKRMKLFRDLGFPG